MNPTSPTRVLVAEDEAVIALELKHIVRDAGFEICGLVSTAREAIETAATVCPDLVLMDVRLRGDMDGVTAAERIVAQLPVPVVFVTAHADKATIERASAIASGFIAKPLDQRTLEATMKVALARRADSQPPAGTISPYEDHDDAVLGVDLRERVVVYNRAARSLFGWSPEEIVRLTIRDLLGAPGETTGSVSPLDLTDRQQNRSADVVCRTKSGEVLPAKAAFLLPPGGPIVVMAIRPLARRLELDLAKVAGLVADDLRGLLARVESGIDGSVKRNRTALASARAALEEGRLVADELRRLSNREPRLSFTGVDLAAVAGRCVPSTPIEGEASVVARADEGLVEEIVRCLGHDARPSSPEGALRLRVGRVEVADGREAASLGIQTGSYATLAFFYPKMGMSALAIDGLFGGAGRDETAGPRLWLALAVSFVRQLGGCLDVRSAAGEGTTMTVYLPALDSALATCT